MSYLKMLTWAVVAVFLFQGHSVAQFDPELIERLDRNTLAVIRVENLDRIKDVYETSLADSFEEILDFCTEEPHPLYSKDLAADLSDRLDGLLEKLSQVESLDLVIHEWDKSDVCKFSLIIYLKNDSAKKIADQLENSFEFISSAFELSATSVDTVPRIVKGLSVDKVSIGESTCVLVTNSKALTAVNETEEKKNLTDSRRFRTFEVFIERSTFKKDLPLIVAYLKPEGLKQVMGGFQNEKLWNAMKIKELPLAAFQISIDDQDVLLARSMITATKPHSGTAAKWLGLKYIEELPDLKFRAASIEVNGIDSSKLIKYQRAFYDEAYGEGSFAKVVKNHFGRNDEEFFEQLAKRTCLKYQAEFLGDEDRLMILEFQRILDDKAMNEVVAAIVSQQDRRLGDKYGLLKKAESDDATTWTYLPREAGEFVDERPAHAIVGEWYVTGEQKYILEQVEEMSNSNVTLLGLADSFPGPVAKYVEDFSPMSVVALSEDHWTHFSRQILAGRAIKRGGKPLTPDEIANVKAIMNFGQALEIKHCDDRVAVARYRLAKVLAGRFGSVVNLFRVEQESYFESLTIVSSPSN